MTIPLHRKHQATNLSKNRCNILDNCQAVLTRRCRYGINATTDFRFRRHSRGVASWRSEPELCHALRPHSGLQLETKSAGDGELAAGPFWGCTLRNHPVERELSLQGRCLVEECVCCGILTPTRSMCACWPHWTALPEELRSDLLKSYGRGEIANYHRNLLLAIEVRRHCGVWRVANDEG